MLLFVLFVAALLPGQTVLIRKDSAAGRISITVPSELKTGDVLLVRFQLKGGETTVRFEPGPSRFTRPLHMPAEAGSDWKLIQFPFRLRKDYSPQEATLAFESGAGVELRDIELVNYGTSRKVRELTMTRTSYAGSEAGAPWRRAAGERIGKIRKADLTVEVTTAAGKPVAGAAVAVRMKRHAFGFGTAVNGPLLTGQRADVSREELNKYREQIPRLFNKAVMENDLKWQQWEDVRSRPFTLEAVRWLREAGLEVRGHVLVWPAWRWLPQSLAALKDNPPALRKAVLDHIADEAGTMRGKLVEWDVLNEPYTNHDLMDILGKETMVEWFRAARQADAGAKLFINDFAILSGDDTKHQDHYYETIKFLIEQGAPVDAIGLQGHFPAKVTPPEEVLRRMDRFASFGKPLQITEFDIDTIDEQTQADYTRDFLTAFFSHPAATGFLMWGFWEKAHWKPYGAMFREDWSPKPNAEAYQDLVFRKWWTNEVTSTGVDGKCAVRGFLGDYEVEVRAGGKTNSVKISLPQGGARTAVIVD